jgi:regulator of protease activity HflC (stomatin/prohibitin superfamily)
MRTGFAKLLFLAIVAVGFGLSYAVFGAHWRESLPLLALVVAVGLIIGEGVKVAAPWDRAVVLRLGRFKGLKGPGIFFIAPVVETIPYWIDTRVIWTSFRAEQTLTRDTVPVDVDAVLFWRVVDPSKAALAVADYSTAIGWASQTALRDPTPTIRSRSISAR